MAEKMDEDMPEDPPLQQDLTCPVCRCIFTDPMVLPCTHSFCRECLQNSLRHGRSCCPLCRETFTKGQETLNRTLSEVCKTFKKHPHFCKIQKADSKDSCNLHMKPLLLYCEKDEEPVCVDCVSLHGTHRLWSLTEAVPICKRQLELKVNIFENKVESYKKMTQKFNNTVEYIKHQAGEAEKQIKMEFQRLHDALSAEERLRLNALAAEEEQKTAAIHKLIENTQRDIIELKKLIVSLKKQMGDEDLPLVQNFQNLKRKAQWTREDRCLSDDSLLNMGEHVGALSFKIWKSLQDHVKYNPVVFDPNTASPWLSVNPDLSSVQESSERLVTPDNPERFDQCIFVLGAEGYESGKHKWDIVVGDNPSWVVGVCKESVARKKKFTVSPQRGVWCIGMCKGVCTAFTNERTELQVQQRPERIRIKLNIDKGEVSFWDGETEKHLVTLSHKFDEKMFPFFGPGLNGTAMILAPGKVALHTS